MNVTHHDSPCYYAKQENTKILSIQLSYIVILISPARVTLPLLTLSHQTLTFLCPKPNLNRQSCPFDADERHFCVISV